MRIFLFIAFFGFALPSFGITATSIADGDYRDAATWDCGCIPTANDDVVINHVVYNNQYVPSRNLTINNGARFNTNAFVWVLGDLYIASGGLWDCTSILIVEGDYIVDGIHQSTTSIVLDGSGVNIGGVGEIKMDSWLILRYGTKTILPTADLDIPNGYGIYLYSATDYVVNKGIIRMNWLAGFDYTTWINDEASLLEVRTRTYSDFVLDASSLNNTVVYSGNRQFVKSPKNITYYNLSIIKDNKVKALSSNLIILNDLLIDHSELRSNNFNIEIKGDWVDVQGKFKPSSASVTFSGVNQGINSTNSKEKFFNLIINSSDKTSLNTKVNVIGSMIINSKLDANGYNMLVKQEWINNGLFVHNNNEVGLIGGYESIITGNTEFFNLRVSKNISCSNHGNISIRSTLKLKKGTLNNYGNITLLSDVNGTARIDKVTNGAFSGDIIVQRYFPTSTNDWHLIGSPVSGQTLLDWNDDLMTMGFPGSDFPDFYFNNVTYYDETYAGFKDNGLLNAGSINDNIEVGQGWRLYLPIAVTTIDVKGSPNIGDIDLPISYTDTGSPVDDGWNLIANPYASTINWNKNSGWNKSGLKDAIYIWNPANSQYTSYVSGVGTNGGSKFIPSTQAFWIQASNVSPTLTIKEQCKSSNDVAIKRLEVSKDYFRVQIASNNGFKDELVVRVDEQATHFYDSDLDALELRSPVEGVPSIAVVGAGQEEYSIYSFAHEDDQYSLPLNIRVSVSGQHIISFDNIDNFISSSCLSFYDGNTNESIMISGNSSIALQLEAGDYINRFSLIICPPINTPVVSDLKSLESGDSEVEIFVRKERVEVVANTVLPEDVEVTIFDIAGRMLFKEIYATSNNYVSFDRPNVNGHVVIIISSLNGEIIESKRVFMN